MSNIKSKYRRPLNDDQLYVLELLFRFRFGDSAMLATCFDKPSSKSVQKRLKILEDQGYIAKRYDKSYKLLGKPAAHYLLPKGAKLFRAHIEKPDDIPDQAIKNRYKDKDASDKFINHSFGIFNVYLKLHSLQQ